MLVCNSPCFTIRALLLHSVDGALAAILALALELDGAVNQSKQGVIAADAHVHAGMDVSAALTNKDVASQRELTVSTLGSKALAFAVATVTGGAHTFFMGEKLKIQLQHDDVPPIK